MERGGQFKNKSLEGDCLHLLSITFKANQSDVLLAVEPRAQSFLSVPLDVHYCGKLCCTAVFIKTCQSQSGVKTESLAFFVFLLMYKLISSSNKTATTAEFKLISLAVARLVVASCVSSLSSSVFFKGSLKELLPASSLTLTCSPDGAAS